MVRGLVGRGPEVRAEGELARAVQASAQELEAAQEPELAQVTAQAAVLGRGLRLRA